MAPVSEFSVAKSLSSILSQIERLQKEAAAIQMEVVARIRKDIEKYGLTAEQLFGNATPAKRNSAKAAAAKPAIRAAAAIRLMCSGVVPPHPPTARTPILNMRRA